MARTDRRWTTAERETVLAMVLAKKSQSAIARAIQTSVPTLRRHFKAELAGRPRVPGSNKTDWTEQERRAILAMASYGIPMDEIALAFGVTRKTLGDHFGDELIAARTRLHASIARSLVTSALVGRNVAAQIFLAKTRLRWTETVKLEHEGHVSTGASDVDLEAALAKLTAKGREALRTLASEAPVAGADDDAPDARTVH